MVSGSRGANRHFVGTGRGGQLPRRNPYGFGARDFDVVDLAAGPLADDVMMSGRVAPPIIGMGLLEAIPESDLRQAADPDERRRRRLGTPQHRVGRLADRRAAIGRFGWKAGQPTVRATERRRPPSRHGHDQRRHARSRATGRVVLHRAARRGRPRSRLPTSMPTRWPSRSSTTAPSRYRSPGRSTTRP